MIDSLYFLWCRGKVQLYRHEIVTEKGYNWEFPLKGIVWSDLMSLMLGAYQCYVHFNWNDILPFAWHHVMSVKFEYFCKMGHCRSHENVNRPLFLFYGFFCTVFLLLFCQSLDWDYFGTMFNIVSMNYLLAWRISKFKFSSCSCHSWFCGKQT